MTVWTSRDFSPHDGGYHQSLTTALWMTWPVLHMTSTTEMPVATSIFYDLPISTAPTTTTDN
jgi:hypothetical protein